VSFSVTLSVNARLGERRPRVLRGMLPYGVRTFLWRALLLTSDHLPSRGIYHGFGRGKGRMNLEARMGGGGTAFSKNFLDSWFPDSLRFF